MVFENNGSRNPARTYQDLLKSAHDGDVFEYFNTHRLKVVNTEGLLYVVEAVGVTCPRAVTRMLEGLRF